MKTLASSEEAHALAARLGKMCPDTPRHWGRMTAGQMVCHLSDAFELSLGTKSASAATGLFQRTLMKWGGLYFPIPWPKGVPTRPELEQGIGGTPPGLFERDRERLVGHIDRFVAADLDGRFHPIFGPMTSAQWKRWGYLHTDHHLRQFGA